MLDDSPNLDVPEYDAPPVEDPPAEPGERNRVRATLAILPFVLLGVLDIALLLFWGLDPLWGFMILPPILFISVIGWIAFKTGFDR